ncbi:MAG: transposase [Methanobrevibacter sp.]|jgi:transposase|nr:transposase [Candidatus Methanovirga meridionalis]
MKNEILKKKLSSRDDWLSWEIHNFIKSTFNITFSSSHLPRCLRGKFKAKFSKPYPIDYRCSPYYKQSFYLKLYNILKKYNLRWDPLTGNIIQCGYKMNHLYFLVLMNFQQFTSNNVRVWSLTKPRMLKNTAKVKSNVAGAYSLTPDGVDLIEFIENSKAVTIVEVLKKIRKANPRGIIILILDNYPSHKANIVKEIATELDIELLYLPTFSPQLQPEEQMWHDTKRDLSEYKVDYIPDLKKLSVKKSEAILKEEFSNSFYKKVKSKKYGNKLFNNFIKPIIKNLNPLHNLDWEVQKIS